jgi:hypothetical protein
MEIQGRITVRRIIVVPLKGHRVLVGKPEGKRPLGRPRRRWKDNIKMDLQEVGGGRGDTGWSWLSIRTGVGTVRDFRVP